MGVPALRSRPLWAATLALAIGAVAAAAPDEHANPNALNHSNNGRHVGRPSRATGLLLPPEGAADTDAVARVDVKFFPGHHGRTERSWFRVHVRRLEANTEYTLWGDDPADGTSDLVQIASFTTGDFGNARWVQDTRHGGTLPFGASLDALGGTGLEVRSADGTTTLLAGTVPDITP